MQSSLGGSYLVNRPSQFDSTVLTWRVLDRIHHRGGAGRNHGCVMEMELPTSGSEWLEYGICHNPVATRVPGGPL